MEIPVIISGVLVAAIITIPIVKGIGKGIVAVSAVTILSVLSGYLAIVSIYEQPLTVILPGTSVTGEILIQIDALSSIFILIIDFTFLTGSLYGFAYLKSFANQNSRLSLHWIALLLEYISLLALLSLQNGLAFLVAWEIMVISAFFLIIFEHEKISTIRAGINYLIQSHIGLLFLTLAFIWVAQYSGSYDFQGIEAYSRSLNTPLSLGLFVLFFIGFAFKAGFVPFHTWLPHAHPAAPAHISGMMSGVIIKAGIYGILRMLLMIHTDYILLGYIILLFSVVSGVYGVMLAVMQHNLKRLLAYHSIENIGIIGIGIGMGCIGLGTGNGILVILGLGGAILHTFNHSLFKSLLFYTAGNVYQSTHTVNLDLLGGLIKRLPRTSLLFLVASLAICGLPPFNGFISEFLIFSAMFNGLKGANLPFLSFLIFSIFGLALIGGLALFCFTKAFGIVFLGQARQVIEPPPGETHRIRFVPLYAILILIVAVGVLPQYFAPLFLAPAALHIGRMPHSVTADHYRLLETLSRIGFSGIGFFLLSGILFFIRKMSLKGKSNRLSATWGCGYAAANSKMQYTGSSYARSFGKLAEPILSIEKKKREIMDVFPGTTWFETKTGDGVEKVFIHLPLMWIRKFLEYFTFLQNGNPRFYILYGLVFIVLILSVPKIFNFIVVLLS